MPTARHVGRWQSAAARDRCQEAVDLLHGKQETVLLWFTRCHFCWSSQKFWTIRQILLLRLNWEKYVLDVNKSTQGFKSGSVVPWVANTQIPHWSARPDTCSVSIQPPASASGIVGDSSGTCGPAAHVGRPAWSSWLLASPWHDLPLLPFEKWTSKWKIPAAYLLNK